MKLARLFKGIGTFLLVILALICIPIGVPRLFNYQTYVITTESMEPTYPAGGLIYVKSTTAEEIEYGDVITYRLGSDTDMVITHRVVEINESEQTFITQGDANELQDPEPVRFDRLLGVPVCSVKGIGFVVQLIGTALGKTIIACSLILVFVLWWMSDWMEKKLSTTDAKQPKSGKSNMLKVLGILLMVIAGLGILSTMVDYMEEDDYYDVLGEKYTKMQDVSSEHWQPMLQVDYELLKEVNEDVVGWIYFENEEISYPILQGKDNNEYLHTNIDGEESNSGSIFLDSHNRIDFLDSHSIVYGHNMRDLSMFGRLKWYRTKEGYLEDHQYFVICTPERAYRYKVVAYQEVEATGYIYQVPYGENDEFETFLVKLLDESLFDTEEELDKYDKIVTLSTCTTQDTYRFTVSGVLVDVFEQK